MKEVRKEECIITQLTTRGKGTPESPIRKVTEVWNSRGEKIAEYDPCALVYSVSSDKFEDPRSSTLTVRSQPIESYR